MASRTKHPKAGLVVAVETRVAETARAIEKGLVAYNVAQAGPSKWKRFAVSVRDEAGTIKGGVVGYTMWNWCFIELVWLDEALRGTGFGTELMARAEAVAAKRGARHVYLDTFSFQGDGFYQKLGYEVYGELGDFPPGHRRIWLKKDLS
ncbi:MAG: GNAT family N-acetyltransferase [Phreatobacter sp.]|uniref:GNAT family N-acetyltransferase n=1 Tax=Phreatobacter sp. TaxID=1966341 RepID=UPI0027354B80|nr:GNAT family N-acetyltransferase [Phreatobacter sp.]MDP2803344.1 GNAT family N-acetyltransferase [Phreatobacter sp.]